MAPVFTSTTESYAHLGVGIRRFSTQLQSVLSGPCIDMRAGSKTTTAAGHRWWKCLVSQWNWWCNCKGNSEFLFLNTYSLIRVVGHSQPCFPGRHDILPRGSGNSTASSLAWWQDGFWCSRQSPDGKCSIWWGDVLCKWTCKVCWRLLFAKEVSCIWWWDVCIWSFGW